MTISSHYPDSHEASSSHPFCREGFFKLLETSQVVGADQGWLAIYFSNARSILPSYLKSHSYGEYIFDWQWAEAYQRYGVNYYPKLIHALPFTPVNAPKIWGGDESSKLELINESFEFYQRSRELTGEHYLFIDDDLAQELKKKKFLEMISLQYHWHNKSGWNNFDDFLQSLKRNRKKMMSKERKKVDQYGLEIQWKSGTELTEDLMGQIYQLYLQTIEKKNAFAYLNESFFKLIPTFLNSDLKVLLAYEGAELIAMSLFVSSDQTLFGRYWGIQKKYEVKYPLLHFEMCYYRGLDYCFQQGIKLFEAGAQGEQKLWRGFTPVAIKSAHHLRDERFYDSVKNFLSQQNQWQMDQINDLKTHLPYLS